MIESCCTETLKSSRANKNQKWAFDQDLIYASARYHFDDETIASSRFFSSDRFSFPFRDFMI